METTACAETRATSPDRPDAPPASRPTSTSHRFASYRSDRFDV